LGEALITNEDAAQAYAHAQEEDHDACISVVLAVNDMEPIKVTCDNKVRFGGDITGITLVYNPKIVLLEPYYKPI
jgi:hypothetical protein